MQNNKGFSLVELSVVISVAASLMVGFLSWTQPPGTTNAVKSAITYTQMRDIQKALDNFRVSKKRLPCPADPLMRPDGSRASGTDYITPASGSDAYVNSFGMEDLYNTSSSGLITAGVSCPVSVGALPVFALGLDESFYTDGWGRVYTYQVSPDICGTNGQTALDSNAAGVGCTDIDYQTKTPNLIVNDGAAVNITKNAAYVLVSHGANGAGAFLPSGVKLTAGSGNEAENSNGDTTYVKAQTTASFDDLVAFGTKNQIENTTSRTNMRSISVEDCEKNSQALSKITLTETGTMKTNITNYQQNTNTQNSGDKTLLGIMKATQSLCVKYYGAGDSVAAVNIGGKIWHGAQCPGNNNPAVNGKTYVDATDSCVCYDGLWNGSCTVSQVTLPVLSGAVLWFDADDNSTLFVNSNCSTGANPVDGAAISCWKDKSGNNNNALSTMSAESPTYSTTSNMSGKPTMVFNGSTNYFLINNSASLALSNTRLTDFVVVNVTDFATERPLFNKIWTPDYTFSHYLSGTDGMQCFQAGNGCNLLWVTRPSPGADSILAGRIRPYACGTGSTTDVYLQGVKQMNSSIGCNTGNSVSTSYAVIGRRSMQQTPAYMKGKIAEIILYNRDLTDQEIINVHRYLGAKWGITVP